MSNTIEVTIRSWARTTNPKTDIQDEDWKTLFAMCDKCERDKNLEAKIEGMMIAAEIKICEEEHLSPIGLAMECLTEYRQAILTAVEQLRKD